jgi:hypothetical protein
MRTRTFRLIFLLGAIVTIAVASLFWIKITQVQAQEPQSSQWQHPGKLIDQKASKLRADDENSVRALADEVFNYPHAFGRMPIEIESGVKQRLVQAEVAFHTGRHSGVSEEDVVTLVNQIGNKLGLPSYARTTPKQVRTIRMSLMLESPQFMASRSVRPDMRTGESISSEMSVLQAAHVTQVLLDQKFINPDFQVDPAEWDQQFHQKMVERIKQAEATPQAKQSANVTHHTFSRSNPKRLEMDRAFVSGASSLSVGDASSLVDQAFTTLRLNQ